MTPRTRRPAAVTSTADRGPLLGALLRRAHQVMIAEVTRELVAAGHSETHASYNAVIRPLWDNPDGLRASDLAVMVHITKQSMGALVDQLEVEGYVERLEDPADKRAKLVRLTKRGRDAGRIARAAVRKVEAAWARRIGSQRLEALRETLTELLASLELSA